MTRLLVHVEGQTEENFVNLVLEPHLRCRGFSKISARLIGNARQRSGRGGSRTWDAVRRGITNHLKEDRSCIVTTMVDYYGMPKTRLRAWPGRFQAAGMQFPENAKTVEDELSTDIQEKMGRNFDARRFIPYVMMHEFEAMLFSDCEKFSQGIGLPQLAGQFQKIRDQFASPEEIDDSPDAAPSKRIAALVPGYEKPRMGTLAALAIGICAIHNECPQFRRWLERLERVPEIL